MRARELLRRLEDVEVAELTSASLASALAAQVRAGSLPAGVELPSERDLATALGRSRGTIARAYEQLRAEGLAHTRQGAGTTIGCCAGPWASSRAAELDPILPVIGSRPTNRPEVTIDLRSLSWVTPSDASGGAPGIGDGGTAAGPRAAARTPGRDDGVGTPEGSVAVDGVVRALDVALATLLRPGERVLVPALADPRLLALLRVRGLHPVALPVDAAGRADVPGWVQRLRSRAAAVAVLAASHAAPAGVSLAAHERRLVVEAAAAGEVTLVDDRSAEALWLDTPPPPALADLDEHERTVSVLSTFAAASSRSRGGALAWIHTPSAALRQRFEAVALALDAAPATALPAGTAAPDAHLLAVHRQHLVDHTAAVIRVVTPVAPQVRVAPAAGGPLRLLHLGAVPGSVVADAARERGVLVHAGSACAVGAEDLPAVSLSLTGPTDALVTGLRVLLEVVGELS